MSDKLHKLAVRLEVLVGELPQYRAILDVVAGGLFALLRAQELDYKHRAGPLSDAYLRNLALRLARMAHGQLPRKHAWLAGFYFNSAIHRIAAAGEQLEGILTRIERRARRSRKQIPDSITLTSVRKVRNEVDRFKHDESGFEGGRNVPPALATHALEEILDALDSRKGALQGVHPQARKRRGRR